MDPVTAADCRLLLSLLKFAIVPPDQRERVEDWLRAKEAALTGMERLEKDLREMAATGPIPMRYIEHENGFREPVPGVVRPL